MVDVGAKPVTPREAIAAGRIRMNAAAWRALRSQSLAKGDALSLARAAGIAAAKRTSELIPLCHVVPLDHVGVEVRLLPSRLSVEARSVARARWRTGVEMEALVAVAASLLTIYDMAKSLDRGMVIGSVRLLRKTGGRSGEYRRGGVRGDRRAVLRAPGPDPSRDRGARRTGGAPSARRR
jgi:cyclic pyranopterin phosphate synthase